VGATPKYNLRYPALADPADITQIQTLAQDVETAIDAAALPAVALHAQMTADAVSTGLHDVTFNNVMTNVGAWTVSGTLFLVPVRGIYVVHTHIEFSDGDWGSAGLYLNGQVMHLGYVMLRQPTNFIGQGTTLPFVAFLSAGWSLGVKVNSATAIRARGGNCTLSAALVAKY